MTHESYPTPPPEINSPESFGIQEGTPEWYAFMAYAPRDFGNTSGVNFDAPLEQDGIEASDKS